jgi:hypothetical protein
VSENRPFDINFRPLDRGQDFSQCGSKSRFLRYLGHFYRIPVHSLSAACPRLVRTLVRDFVRHATVVHTRLTTFCVPFFAKIRAKLFSEPRRISILSKLSKNYRRPYSAKEQCFIHCTFCQVPKVDFGDSYAAALSAFRLIAGSRSRRMATIPNRAQRQ